MNFPKTGIIGKITDMKRPSTNWEREVIAGGCPAVIGVDEAGRGCLAGPVVAAAVAFDWSKIAQQARRGLGAHVRDSKLMTREQRKVAYDLILSSAVAVGVGEAGVATIDQVNILQATFEAMRSAIEQARLVLACTGPLVFVDGNQRIPQLTCAQRTVIDGDLRVFSISAASIVAKEHRDRLMESLDKTYPEYGFAQHKGYGTKEHYGALRLHGLSPLHRRSFCADLQNTAILEVVEG